MINNGQEASKWLARITEDQNLNQLSELENVPYDTLRRLFVSAMLQPSMEFAHYNPTSSRLVLGPHGYFVPSIEFTTTSAAALTLTCPAGHRYRIYSGSAVNVTQASTVSLGFTIGGYTPGVTPVLSNNSQTQHNVVIGMGGALVLNKNVLPELWLNAGDSATLTLNTYAAGNDTEHLILFEDYEV